MDSVQSNEASNEDSNGRQIIFDEEILTEGRSDPVLADDERILASYRSDREDVRAVIPPILQSSGLLLSLSLGAIYFILKDGHEIAVNISLIAPLLILIALFLAGAILAGALALYKRPSKDGVTKKDLVEYERRSRAKDHLCGGISIGIMMVAVFGIVFVLALFWCECNSLSTTSNSSGDTGPMVVVIVGPNHSDISNGLSLNNSDYKSLLKVGPKDHDSRIVTFHQ